jgi:hypothetical protein
MNKNTKRSRDWELRNPDKVKAARKRRYAKVKKDPILLERKREERRRYFASHKEVLTVKQREWLRKKLQALKDKIFDKLGHCCSRCGYSDKRALCIDHVNGGGFKELRSMSVAPYYKKVLADTTGSYQILCHNCNWIKRAENGEVRKS